MTLVLIHADLHVLKLRFWNVSQEQKVPLCGEASRVSRDFRYRFVVVPAIKEMSA
jgi:hypothetical protein